MPHDSELNAGHLENEYPPTLLSHQKAISLGIVLITAGYSAFADTMECIYTIEPLRFEYKFEHYISKKNWLIITITTAGLYGLSTLLCEGKGVYDTVSHYFLERNKKTISYQQGQPFPFIVTPLHLPSPSRSFLIWFSPRFISFVRSAAKSSETTMGLVKEGATLPKTIAISILSFLGFVSFYGPITVDAIEELFLGKKNLNLEENQTRFLSAIIGYPVAIFSALQDTLECGASLFKNFRITGTANQWAIVGVSSLAGLSGLCLDGKKGVEIIDAFFAHLESHYAWLPHSFLNNVLPSPIQFYQLGYELSTLTLAAYAASFIAFADKELTISLSKSILATLGAEIHLLPHILGWCVVLRDFVIQTKTLHMLEQIILSAAYRGWNKLKQSCCEKRPESAEEVEATQIAAYPPPELASDQEEDDSGMEDNEETPLLSQSRFSEYREKEEKTCSHRFFKSKAKDPQRNYLEPERKWRCLVM